MRLDAPEPEAIGDAAELNKLHPTAPGGSRSDALEFTALIACRNRERSRRMASRWRQRYLDETPGVTIDDAATVAGFLAARGARAGARVTSTAPCP